MNDVLHSCRAVWRSLGVAPEIAEDMANELLADLAAAGEAGVEPLEYVGGDAEAFAAGWAHGRGVVRPRQRLGSTVAAALLGAVPGAGFALFVAYGMSSPAMKEIVGFDLGNHPLAIVSLYAVGAIVACGGAVASAAAWLSWQDDLAVIQTVRRLTSAVPLGAVLAVGLSMALGASRGFSTSGKVVAAEVFVVALVLSLVVALARRSAVRNFVARPADDQPVTGKRAPLGAGWGN
jgi:hypothetical protein